MTFSRPYCCTHVEPPAHINGTRAASLAGCEQVSGPRLAQALPDGLPSAIGAEFTFALLLLRHAITSAVTIMCGADIWEADPRAPALKPKQAERQPTGLAQCRDEEFQLYAGSTSRQVMLKDAAAADRCEISIEHLLCY